jgi:hypothetical protein
VLFQLFIPEITPVSLLESESVFEIVTQLAETRKRAIFTSIFFGHNGSFLFSILPVCITFSQHMTSLLLANKVSPFEQQRF